MWLTDGFSVTFLEGGGEGDCKHRKTWKVQKTSIFNKGGGEYYWIS